MTFAVNDQIYMTLKVGYDIKTADVVVTPGLQFAT
jgi:hypothetical protein